LAEEIYVSLKQTFHNTSEDALNHLSTAKPTGEYFSVAKIAGE
jgi:hypothetical protein